MNNKVFFSLIIAVGVIVAGLFFQASQSGVSQVLLPSDLAADPQTTRTRIRLAGRVAADTVSYNVEPQFLLRFAVHDPDNKTGPTIPVSYQGIKPDMFAPGRDVILDGEWQTGLFTAHKLMTQCPSKYEPPTVSDKYPQPSKEY